MINVRFYVNKGKLCMKAEGHAASAPAGEDIVCAGVSALSVALADTLMLMDTHGQMEAPPQIRMDNGNATIKVRPEKKALGAVLIVFTVIQSGMIAIMRGYPEYIRVKTFDQAEVEALSNRESSTLTDSL